MRRPDPQKEERDLYVHFSHTCLYTDAYMYALFCADTAEHIDVYTHVHVYVDAACSDEWTAQHRQDRTLERKSTDESANIENRRSLCFSFESSRFDGACFKARSSGQCPENSSKIVVRSFRRTTPSGTEPIEATRTIRVSFPLALLAAWTLIFWRRLRGYEAH